MPAILHRICRAEPSGPLLWSDAVFLTFGTPFENGVKISMSIGMEKTLYDDWMTPAPDHQNVQGSKQ
jgi:hypothetical protein